MGVRVILGSGGHRSPDMPDADIVGLSGESPDVARPLWRLGCFRGRG